MDAINVPAVLAIDPVVAVTLTAVPLVAALIKALAPRLTLPPAVTVIDPDAVVTVEPIVILPVLAKVAKLMLPVPVVVIPLVVKLPVPAVKLKFTALKTAFTLKDVTLLVIVYVVNPIPAAKLIACVVLTAAVTVKPVIVPAALPCNKST